MKKSFTDPIKILVTSMFILLAAPLAAEDMAAAIADAATELRVKTALLTEIGWDMVDIDVEAHGSYVTLLGEADTRANKEMAKEVALAVDGVEKVKNRLALVEAPSKQPVGAAVTDAEREVGDALLETRVKTALIGEIGFNAFDIEVEATDGEVSLRGELESKEHHSMALETAKKCSGVDKVIDLLSVS